MIVYDTGHVSSASICPSIAEGFGWERIAKTIAPRGRAYPWPRPLRGPAAFYGRDRGTLDVARQCEADWVPWFMVDNGYIGAAQYDGFYKISRNAFQCDGRGLPDERRLATLIDKFGIKLQPWRAPTDRGHVLVCPPISDYDRVHWFWTVGWCNEVRKAVVRAKRKMRIRWKPTDLRAQNEKPRTLAEDFHNCHALITHDSNIVVEATVAGIPAFVTGASPAQRLGNADLHAINEPRLGDDREEWLAVLAANQWTLDEIRAGAANTTLGIA